MALDWLGVMLCAAFLGTFMRLLFDLEMVHTADSTTIVWIALLAVGTILGVGLSWALIRARTTGQIEVQ